MNKLIPLVVLALMSGAAMAADTDKPMRERETDATFDALDQNRDQRISQSEATGDQNVSARFAALDANGDGALTKRELTAGAKSDKPDSQHMPKQPTPEPYK